jgi:hypothetical protein
MKKLAIATAAVAMLATPAMAQFVGGYVESPSYSYGPTYSYSLGPTYGYAVPRAYGYVAPFGTFNSGLAYDRELDIATEPDPNIRAELRREQTLNLDLRP